MALASVDPEQLATFRKQLITFSQQTQQHFKVLTTRLAVLGAAGWMDQQHQNFTHDLQVMGVKLRALSDELEKVHAAELQKMIKHIEEYQKY